MIGSTGYHDGPGLIGAFYPEWKVHEHIPTKKQTALDTIWDDHGITALNIGKRILQGAFYSTAVGVYAYFLKGGPKKFLSDRVTFNQGLFAKNFRFHAAYGALGGFFWYLLYDASLCKHGSATMTRHVIAYAIAGGLLTATLLNPSAFFFGSIFGGLYGIAKDSQLRVKGPKGFEANFPNFDLDARERARRDDVERKLSHQLALAQSERKLTAII